MVAGVVNGGTSRTALVLVLSAVDAGGERVLPEVVPVWRRDGRRQLPAVLLVRARRMLRRRRPGVPPARAPLRRSRADLPHQLPDRVPDSRTNWLPSWRRTPAAISETSLLILFTLVAITSARRSSISIWTTATLSRWGVIGRRLCCPFFPAIARTSRILVPWRTSVATVVPMLFRQSLLRMTLPLRCHRPVVVLDRRFAEGAVGF